MSWSEWARCICSTTVYYYSAITVLLSCTTTVLLQIHPPHSGNFTDVKCEDSTTCISSTCVSTAGSYICECPPDFELNPTHIGCVDTWSGNCYLDIKTHGDNSGTFCSSESGVGVSKAFCCCSLDLKSWSGIIFMLAEKQQIKCKASSLPSSAF